MSTSNEIKVSQGNNFKIVKQDRSYGGATTDVLAVDGTTGIATVADLLLQSGKVFGAGAAQALSGVGAIDVTHLVTKYTSTGVAQAVTLADGKLLGQLKIIHHTVDGGSAVVTPTHAGNFATFTMTALHDWAILYWNGTAWDVLAATAATIA